MAQEKRAGTLAALGLGQPVQLAYCVADAELAAHTWVQTVGAGPFFIRRHIPVTNVEYRGAASTFDHTSAYGQWGGVMVELVQNHNLTPSVLADPPHSVPDDAPRLHHVACLVDDFDATLRSAQANGVTVAMRALARTTPFAFLDTVAILGHFVEVYPRTESIVSFYSMVASAHLDWDGTEPVRVLG